jgi:hypothetical protein
MIKRLDDEIMSAALIAAIDFTEGEHGVWTFA